MFPGHIVALAVSVNVVAIHVPVSGHRHLLDRPGSVIPEEVGGSHRANPRHRGHAGSVPRPTLASTASIDKAPLAAAK